MPPPRVAHADPRGESTESSGGRESALLAGLAADLSARADASLLRELRAVESDGRFVVMADGRRLLNLAGNDYLGLSQHPALVEAAIAATQTHGTGAGASRLVSGTSPLHTEVEARFAAFKHAEAALLFVSGYTANLGLLSAVARPGDLIVQDRLNHASLIDAARQSGAAVRTVPHGAAGHAKTARLLAAHAGAAPTRRRFLVTDSVFSMDGDAADLPALLALAERHDAHLIVDEAHATGVLGAAGAGLVEAQGVSRHPRLLAAVSTASKALGGLGGVVTGSRVLIDTLVNHARTLIYTTAPPPAQAAALEAALGVIDDEPRRRERLARISSTLRDALAARGWPDVLPGPYDTPIVPLRIDDTDAAVALADRLEADGVLAVAIRPPTVPPGTARVRLGLRWDLTDDEVVRVVDAVGMGPGAPERKVKSEK